MKAYEESLVRITGPYNKAAGTGFVIWHKQAETYILTCQHVVDQATKDRPAGADRTVLLEGIFEGWPRYEAHAGGPDLSVLVANAPDLLNKPALSLGRIAYSLNPFIVGYYQIIGEDNDQPRKAPYKIVLAGSESRHSQPFYLENKESVRIIPGHSGSPVVDFDWGRVIGVTTATPAQRRPGGGHVGDIIAVTPIECLEQVWTDMPLDLVLDVDARAELRIKGGLIERLGSFDGVRLRVLLTSSAPTEAANVNDETATIKAAFKQNLIPIARRSHFSVEVYEWLDATRFRLIVSAALPSDSGIIERTGVDGFDLVIMVVWHNVGNCETGLREFETQLNAEGGPPSKLLLFYREDPVYGLLDGSRQAEEGKTKARGLAGSVAERSFSDRRIRPKHYRREDFDTTFHAEFERALEEFVTAAGSQPNHAPALATAVDNPYRGLSPYLQENAELFFGRATEVRHLCERLEKNGNRFLAVVGTSGSGKSSLLRAGLLYRLSLDAIPGSSRWPYIELSLANWANDSPRYGVANELFNLLRRSGNNTYARVERLDEELADPTKIAKIVRAVLASDAADRRLILFVDQFEELFTLVRSEAEQDRFAHFLADAVQSPQVNVVITLRADYYDRVLQVEQLAHVLRNGVYSPPQPLPSSFLAMIECPAEFNGLKFEDRDLSRDILRDAGTETGALPLLSYALQQLAEPNRLAGGNTITRAAFEALGGVKGVIQKKADGAIMRLYSLLSQQQVDDSLRVLFRHLVRVDEHGTAARKPAPYAPSDPIWEEAHQVADELIKERLLQTEKQEGSKATIQIAHEALMTQWPRLKGWIDTCHESLLFQQRVEAAAREWHAARSRQADDLARLRVDHDLLWPHSRLQEAERTLRNLGLERERLKDPVKAFLRPEGERLLDELSLDVVDHSRRAWIGDRLAELGDTRPGVGLRPDGLPDIEWCRPPVPDGLVQIDVKGKPEQFDVKPFYIAKYVVTLAQFNAFATVAPGSPYFEDEWWRNLPVQPSEHRPVRQDPNVPNHPAQFVSWFQAVAYCRWLSRALKYSVSCPIRLPTEWEWQQAATGARLDYLYPWGREWNPKYANTRDGGVGRLLSVGMYPRGASPVGAMDMSGNMYEWCQNEYDDVHNVAVSEKPRTTRGGAWFTLGGAETRDVVTVTARLRDNPHGYVEADGARRGIRVCIRLVCDQPPSWALQETLT